MIPKLWLRFIAFLALCFWIAGLPLTSLARLPYDVQWSVSVANDGCVAPTAIGYDVGDVLTTHEENNRTLGERLLLPQIAKFLAAKGAATLPEGSFSIANWSGYPANLPKPTGPFRLLEGAEYNAARAEANAANRAMHQADPALNGLQIHEIQPVKFGGSPTDPLNKIPLTPQQHSPATTWWNQLQRSIEP